MAGGRNSKYFRCFTFNISFFQAKCRDFENMLWFESLLFYGCEEREQEKDDVDVALLPTIVEKVILPKLTGRDF